MAPRWAPRSASCPAAGTSWPLHVVLAGEAGLQDPEKFGQGAIEGVAAPESANNAAAQTSFIPLLTLGLPAHPVMALLVGAFIIQGITPGPNVINDEPELFWGLIASFWVGNVLLVMLNLPLIGLWVRMISRALRACCSRRSSRSPRSAATPSGLNPWDVYAVAIIGVLGYFLIRWGCEAVPLLFGFVLGPLLEENLRRAMIISRGDPCVFVTRPISAVSLPRRGRAGHRGRLLPAVRRKREAVFRRGRLTAIVHVRRSPQRRRSLSTMTSHLISYEKGNSMRDRLRP